MNDKLTPAVMDARNALITALQEIHYGAFCGGSKRGQRIDTTEVGVADTLAEMKTIGEQNKGVKLEPGDALALVIEFNAMRSACDRIEKACIVIPALVENLVKAIGVKSDAEPYSWVVGRSKYGADVVVEPMQSGQWGYGKPNGGSAYFNTLADAIADVKKEIAEGRL